MFYFFYACTFKVSENATQKDSVLTTHLSLRNIFLYFYNKIKIKLKKITNPKHKQNTTGNKYKFNLDKLV